MIQNSEPITQSSNAPINRSIEQSTNRKIPFYTYTYFLHLSANRSIDESKISLTSLTVRGAHRAPRLGERHAPRRRFKKVSSYFVLTRHFAPREFTDCRAFPPHAPFGVISVASCPRNTSHPQLLSESNLVSGKERSPLALTRRNETPFLSRRGADGVSARLEALIFHRRPQLIFLGNGDCLEDAEEERSLRRR